MRRVHFVVCIITVVKLSSSICRVNKISPPSTCHLALRSASQPRHNDQPSVHEIFLSAPMHMSTLSICRGCEVGGWLCSWRGYVQSLSISAFLRSETAYVPWFWAMLAAIQVATRRVSATQSSRTSHSFNSHSLAYGRAIILRLS